MADNLIHLTYRELADRLGTSPDAARMKAKRAVSKGRWRIIPGNHPNDPVRVELPAADIGKPERRETVGGERTKSDLPERKGRTAGRTDDAALAGLVAALQSSQERIRELTDTLATEKDQHRDTTIALAQAETREMALAGEVERLEATITQLQDELHRKGRSWWRRMMSR